MTDDDQRRSRTEGFREGIRQGLGVLSAFKDAIEETIREARDRGDLSSERAKEIMQDAMDRAQAAADDAKERFDFVNRRELEDVRAELAALENRVAKLEDEESADGDAGAAGTGSAEEGRSYP